jgi:hypothetical protein
MSIIPDPLDNKDSNDNRCECTNDCLERQSYPKRPENRPGLPHIDYRIGTYNEIREAIHRQLNLDRLLAPWTYREPDDPGIALLEGAAVIGDILTYYQELYANEAYLRTAQWRESIADLTRLTGYLLSPGTGGKADFAVEVNEDKNKTGKAVTVPAGFPIKAQLTGQSQAVQFETLRQTTAYPHLNQFNLYRRLYTPQIRSTTSEFYIFESNPDANPITLEKGDQLFIGRLDSTQNPSQFMEGEIITIEDTRQLHDTIIYKIKGSLIRQWNTQNLYAFKLGRSFKHYGYNAPTTYQAVDNSAVTMKNQQYSRPTNKTTTSLSTPSRDELGTYGVRILSPNLTRTQFPLDIEVDNLAGGQHVIVQSRLCCTETQYRKKVRWYRNFTQVRTIRGITPIAMAWGSQSGATSMLTLNSPLTGTAYERTYDMMDIRRIQLHEVLSPLLQIKAAYRETETLQGKTLYFYGTAAEARTLENRRLLFEKKGDSPYTANVTAVHQLQPQLDKLTLPRSITLDKVVNYYDFPNKKPIVTVYGNLLETDQGKTEKETVLGNGDHRRQFQSFKIPKAPLTYHNRSDASPPEVPELEIYVNERLWKRVNNFFDRKPHEEIYIVREDNVGNSWVQFGDGQTGSRLPSGLRNVNAVYRTGIGAYGPLKEKTNPQGGKLDRLDKVHMLQPSTGGAQPESGSKAREAAPGKTKGLGRLVSLEDYEIEALAIPGVSRAHAQWDASPAQSALLLTLLMETGRQGDITSLQNTLNSYNRDRGPQRYPIRVLQGKRSYIYIQAQFGWDPTYRENEIKKAINVALGIMDIEKNNSGLFSLRNRRFGQNAYATRIEGIIQNVEGVCWSKVTALYELGESESPSQLTPLPPPGRLMPMIDCDSRHILCLHRNHLQLTGTKDKIRE